MLTNKPKGINQAKTQAQSTKDEYIMHSSQ
jgi:hypothetical protein